jgi:tRNA pseudouridine55 synthase
MAASRNTRRVDGFLLLDKPRGLTSNAALQRVKRLYQAQRAGHTGTLDPMASGLLPVCLGEATKFAGELLDADKAYRAEVMLGVRTDTGDAEGEVVEQRAVSLSEEAMRHRMEAVLQRFRGAILQTPPMYSALKVAGKPLYAYAREGRSLERSARPVVIHELRLLNLKGPRLELDVACSKGTYIRVLAEDIGQTLGYGAHLSGLSRTAVGPFRLDQARRLEELEAMTDTERDGLLLPVDALLSSCAAVRLGVDETARFGQGQGVLSPDPVPPGIVRVYGADKGFLGTGTADATGRIQPKRLVSAAAARPGA